MNYEKKADRILIFGKEDFSPLQTLECGQVFSYMCTTNGKYIVLSEDKKAEIFENNDGYEIITNNVEYFCHYFDFETNYSSIKEKLEKVKILKEPIRFGSGIRILKQSIFETIVSFCVSANNNIKRIKKTLFFFREKLGKNMGGYYSFPTLSDFQKQNIDFFKTAGCGYRSQQLVKLFTQISDSDIEEMKNMSTQILKAKLVALSGIGPKVADCIMLFGFSRTDVFPVDTWINKVWNDNFPTLDNRIEISKRLVKMFGTLSGYAQQYLFFYKRENG